MAAHDLWVRWQRHALLVAGDAFGGDDEVVDLLLLWSLASRHMRVRR